VARLAAALLLAFLALAAPARADVPAGARTVTAGDVTATLTWEAGPTFAQHPALRVQRAGEVALDVQLARECRGCDGLLDPAAALHVQDLDGDGDPEVFVDVYTEGAHCCTVTPIYGWRGDHYGRVTRDWGNVAYRLKDLDGDGRPEWVTTDDSFAYAFTAYAYSLEPMLVLAYGTDRSGRTALRDVTQGFPALVRSDAASLLRRLPGQRRDGDPRGVIAAYVADLLRLGRRKEALRFLDRSLRRGDLRARPRGDRTWPSDRAYRPALLRFLRRGGYPAG
jgi:hypothetical protein